MEFFIYYFKNFFYFFVEKNMELKTQHAVAVLDIFRIPNYNLY